LNKKTIREQVLEVLNPDYTWTYLDTIITSTGLSKKKVINGLGGLKYTGVIERDPDDFDKWRLLRKDIEEVDAGDEDVSQSDDNIDDEIDNEDNVPPLKIVDNDVRVDEKLINNSITQPIDFSSTDSLSSEEPEEEESLELVGDSTLKHKGLSAKIGDIEQKLDLALGAKQKKEKKAKLKKFNLRKIKQYNRKRQRAVIILGSDQSMRLIKGEYLSGMIRIGQNYYDGSAMFVWLWLGKQPVYVIPEWSIRPLSSKEIYDKAVKNKTLIDSQIITIRAAKMVEQDIGDGKIKKPLKPITWILLMVVIGVVGYLLFGGGT